MVQTEHVFCSMQLIEKEMQGCRCFLGTAAASLALIMDGVSLVLRVCGLTHRRDVQCRVQHLARHPFILSQKKKDAVCVPGA